MKRMTFALLLLLAAPLFAASPRDTMIVDAAWLAAHLHDPDLVLLHVGDKAEYEKKHIPGARFARQQDVTVSDHSGKGLMLEMPPAEELQKKLEALGISDKSRIVVYYGKDWVSATTRIVYVLDYAGLGDRASILDGGMDAWVAAGNPVTDVVPEAKSGSLSAVRTRPIVVDAAFVKAHLDGKGYAVVDGRTKAFYDGVDTGGGPEQKHKTGHIAGARSIPFTEITEESLKFKSPEALRALFTNAGVKPGDTVIGYCHIGQQTTTMLFGARSLGHKVLLYDGSFEDWSRQDGAVENPSAEKK